MFIYVFSLFLILNEHNINGNKNPIKILSNKIVLEWGYWHLFLKTGCFKHDHPKDFGCVSIA